MPESASHKSVDLRKAITLFPPFFGILPTLKGNRQPEDRAESAADLQLVAARKPVVS
jgi:hypothetical protein